MTLNDTALISAIPIELIGKLEFLITILQAVGWFIIFYIIFNVINTIINRKRNRKIDEVIEDLKEIKMALIKKK